ncbi:MAG TPA: hypothetical protein VK152_00060 [Paludibacter sp.]|nr:hypothetical protein [Paludibacter sp.]
MKTKVAGLLVVLMLTTTFCTAQRTITVEAQSNDISNNLDLQAVASTFGESRDLEDFERKLNEYDRAITNLDLNDDGEVDYLRVIESYEDNSHIVVIQAVLDKDIYQDVATIVVSKRYGKTYTQVIGDSYIYGSNYIIEPVYVYTPPIYSFFWGRHYHTWYSPYYWGYYPRHYHYRHPFEVNIYLSNIRHHINRDHRYYYTERVRNENAYRSYFPSRRNDYGTRHPERGFGRRNENIKNKFEYDSKRGASRPSTYQDYDNSRRGGSSRDIPDVYRNRGNSTNSNPGRYEGNGRQHEMNQPRNNQEPDRGRSFNNRYENSPRMQPRTENRQSQSPAVSQPRPSGNDRRPEVGRERPQRQTAPRANQAPSRNEQRKAESPRNNGNSDNNGRGSGRR